MMGADWRLLADQPAWPIDRESLHFTAQFCEPYPIEAVRTGLRQISPVPWDSSLDAMRGLFHLARDGHCFTTEPHRWTYFHEPQITWGFAHFLVDGHRELRLARCIALMKAAAACVGADMSWLCEFEPGNAEARPEEKRVDFFAELRPSHTSAGVKPVGLSIEAKFNHWLSAAQLVNAEAHATSRGWDETNSMFVVVALDLEQVGRVIRAHNRKEGSRQWGAVSWRTLLNRLELETTNLGHDCDDYRRFRRTAWHRAYDI